jgi:hypothetical protein
MNGLWVGADAGRTKLPGPDAQLFFRRIFSREFFWSQFEDGLPVKCRKLCLGGFHLFVPIPVVLLLFGAQFANSVVVLPTYKPAEV